MFTDLQIQHIKMQSAPIWAQLIRRFGWVRIVNDFVGSQTGYKLSVGDRINALLINICTDRSALYHVEKFYAERDVEVLIGPGVVAEDLNDDALALALGACPSNLSNYTHRKF